MNTTDTTILIAVYPDGTEQVVNRTQQRASQLLYDKYMDCTPSDRPEAYVMDRLKSRANAIEFAPRRNDEISRVAEYSLAHAIVITLYSEHGHKPDDTSCVQCRRLAGLMFPLIAHAYHLGRESVNE